MSKYNIIRIPTEEETLPLVISKVYTTVIPPKQTAQLLAFTARYLPPLEGIEHVKRVKRDPPHTNNNNNSNNNLQVRVILTQCQSMTRPQLETTISTHWKGELEIHIDRVPKTVPRTPKQLAECTELWPVSYRPSLLPQMSEIPAAENSNSNSNSNSKDRLYIEECLEMLGTVVVADPKSQKVRVSYQPKKDNKERKNPLDHSVMCSVAQVASCSENTPMMYLCEGLDVFVGFEPCVMCTMALVHSRIGRLFILSPEEKEEERSGGITRYHLHSRRALNHRFAAYRCSLR